jgi:hypothetical protein
LPGRKKLITPAIKLGSFSFFFWLSLKKKLFKMPGRNLTEEERKQVVHELLAASVPGENERILPAGTAPAVAESFGVHTSTVRRIWVAAKKKRERNGVWSATPQKKGRCGRKSVYDPDEIDAAMKAIPVTDRGTMRATAKNLGVALGTVHKFKKIGLIKAHTNAIKPLLTEENKMMRLSYALDRVERVVVGPGQPPLYRFRGVYYEVHVDEKWFYITQINKRYYLSSDEPKPQRNCKHKNHITKVMFLCATARPRFMPNGECYFDGKIRIWPFVEVVYAQRRSRNRAAGTLETKPVTCDKETYLEMMKDEVLPAIRQKWPAEDGDDVTVGIQEDNAKPHSKANDEEWDLLCLDPDERVKLAEFYQAANSPDTNVLDLGFFRSLQSSYWAQTPASTIDGLIDNVRKAFAEYPPEALNKVWLTHATVCNCIIEEEGDNHFDIPHMKKNKLEREGKLPTHIPLTQQAKARFLSYSG